ncbi:GTPase [Muricauda sp. CAU 1633]|uniref:GTPase n=1 Tax=Allomuricauda sp. CAU 1633 TaxID=2816036 RepID=UPI001A8ED240|nr:GTPase [Muricauda sp. CAU 1633]MBO0322692.1 GTPase [Muricauda sp. CAU 1633]
MESLTSKQLIFVYNANSGKRNALLDSMHKVFSPSTYDCNLCDITFGLVTENKIWKKFREQSSISMTFLHKDEFTKVYASKFGHKYTFPIVFMENEYDLEVFIATEELNALETPQELIDMIQERTKKMPQ